MTKSTDDQEHVERIYEAAKALNAAAAEAALVGLRVIFDVTDIAGGDDEPLVSVRPTVYRRIKSRS